MAPAPAAPDIACPGATRSQESRHESALCCALDSDRRAGPSERLDEQVASSFYAATFQRGQPAPFMTYSSDMEVNERIAIRSDATQVHRRS